MFKEETYILVLRGSMMYGRNEWLKLDGCAADLSEEAKDLRAVLLPTEQSPRRRRREHV